MKTSIEMQDIKKIESEEIKSKPRVYIIVLTYNAIADAIECLESLKKINYPDYKIVVVDNGSTGNDVEILRERYKDAILVEIKKNCGFIKGFTTGLKFVLEKCTDADYILLLQNDTTVNSDFLNQLINAVQKNPAIGIASPILYRYYQPESIEFAGEKADFFGIRPVPYKEYDAGANSNINILESMVVFPVCMLIEKNKLIKMKLIQNVEHFYMYGDPAWSLCALKSGFKLAYVPGSVIWHKGAKTTRKMGINKLKWFIRDNTILIFQFIKGRHHKCLTTEQFLYYASWLFFLQAINKIQYACKFMIGKAQGVIKKNTSGE